MQPFKKQFIVLSAATSLITSAKLTSAAPIYAPPPYQNNQVGGYTGSTSSIPVGGPNSIGFGGYEVGNAKYYFTNAGTISSPGALTNTDAYTTGFVLTPSGTTNLAPFSGALTTAGATPTAASSVNTNGTLIAGVSTSDTTDGTSTPAVPTGLAAVWSKTGSGIAVLPAPYTDAFNDAPQVPSSTPGESINNSGTVVARGVTAYNSSGKAVTSNASFVWVNSGNVASPVYSSYSQLLPISSTTTGTFSASAYGISDSGLAAGSASTYNGSGTLTGTVAVTWDTTSTPTASMSASAPQSTIAPVQLVNPTLPTTGTPFGFTGNYTYYSANGSGTSVPRMTSQATFVNSSNKIAGTVSVYDTGTFNTTSGNFTNSSIEPVIWSGAGSTGTFLPLASGYTSGNVAGINAGGDVVGNASKSGAATGVLWKYGASTPTVLQLPSGTNPVTGAAYTGFTIAKGVNDVDSSVGLVGTSTTSSTGYATVWDSTGTATDLDTLVPLVTAGNGTTAGWVTLVAADAISDDGYISGIGLYYDPNASNFSDYNIAYPNPTPGEYYRPFEILDTAAAAPEPTVLLLFGIPVTTGMLLRRRRNGLTTA